MRGVGILFGVKYYVKMWKNTCNGGRLCYRKVKITSNSATEATTHTDESDDYVAWYGKATGTLYLKCYQCGKIVTAGYDNTTGYELRGIGCGGVLSIAESARVDVNVTGGTPKGAYVANGLTTSDSMTLTVTTAGASGDGICGYNSNTSGTCNINLAGGTTHLSEGGRATCTTQATCTVCATRYGALDATNHSDKKGEWQKNESQHWKKYSCCGAEVDTLVPVSDLTKTFEYGKTKEPIFGGALIKDTDYTVSYAVKAGSAGELKDGKPYGAGTYVITVTGIGSCKDSFTKEFVIEKATQADEHEYLSAKSGEEKTEVILQPIRMARKLR